MVTKNEARKYVADVPPEQCFWVNNGPVLKNIEELANALQEMSDESYRHHADKEKNDFSNWIRDVIGDKKLADDLLSSKNKESTLKKISNRLNSFKMKAG